MSINVVKIEFVSLEPDGTRILVAGGAPSDPAPIVSIDSLSEEDMTFDTETRTVTFELTGTVRDPIADIVEGGAADITEVTITVNDVTAITTGVTRMDDSEQPFRPFGFRGLFSQSVTVEIPDSGGVTVVVEATNAFGNKGFDWLALLFSFEISDEPKPGSALFLSLAMSSEPDPNVADAVQLYLGVRPPSPDDPTYVEAADAPGSLEFEFDGVGLPTLDPPLGQRLKIMDFAGLDPENPDTLGVSVHGDETAERHLPPRRQERQERREPGERQKGRRKDTAYGCVLGVFGSLSWRREGLIFGFVDVPVGGHLPSLPSPRKTLAADAKTSLALMASWR